MDISNSHKAHPWHGIDLGENVPDEVRAFIEIVPTDTVKYEVDKASGYLSLDRPQKFSNIVPSLYGFLPRTYCSKHMAELTNQALARYDVEGDGDPLDICVLTEKDVTHGDIIVRARPIGGLRLLDHDQADDKIIAVLKNVRSMAISLILTNFRRISSAGSSTTSLRTRISPVRTASA